MVFEVFGHYQPQISHKVSLVANNNNNNEAQPPPPVSSASSDTSTSAATSGGTPPVTSSALFSASTSFFPSPRPPPQRMLPQPSLPISQPVKSAKYPDNPPVEGNEVDASKVHAKHDILVWFEVLELASSGEYVPVLVDHCDELPCRGVYYLHHGLQRRIRITLVHDKSSSIKWKDVRELVVGRIRVHPESDVEDDMDGSVLSLGLFPGEYLDVPGTTTVNTLNGSAAMNQNEERTMFRFEAAWDSSLHNSLLLNRVTPSGETIYMTISAYLEVCNSSQNQFLALKAIEAKKKRQSN